jgi:hypothetical protein
MMTTECAVRKGAVSIARSVWTAMKAPFDFTAGPLKIAKKEKNLAISGLEGNGQSSTVEMFDTRGRLLMRIVTQATQCSLPLSGLGRGLHLIAVEGAARRHYLRWVAEEQ